MRPWEEIFTETDREVVRKAGFGRRQPFGHRPALLIIDVKRSFLGSVRQNVLQAVEEYATSCGESGWEALVSIQRLLAACRQAEMPVVFTTGDAVTRQFCGGSTKADADKRPLNLEAEEIPEEIAPSPGELVIRKIKASTFFESPLDASLRAMGVDSLLVVGTSTSGCVRASVIDAYSRGYRVFVVEEACFDRFQLSHLVNLWDMNAKYADVITLGEALAYVEGHRQAKAKAPAHAH